VAQRVTNDFFWIDSQRGFPLSIPVTYYQSDGVTPQNLTGYEIVLELFSGWAPGNAFQGTPLLTFNQSSQSHGQIAVTPASGLAVFTFTAAGSLALGQNDVYAYRWYRKLSGVFESRTFFGRWRHRA
jgi:hypothetical protein